MHSMMDGTRARPKKEPLGDLASLQTIRILNRIFVDFKIQRRSQTNIIETASYQTVAFSVLMVANLYK